MQDFLRFKNGPFPQKARKHNLMRLKTQQLHHSFFELQFDTATLTIQSSTMIKAIEVANRGSNLIYIIVRNYLVPGRIYMQCYYSVV